jgi:hypothetical protein
MISVNPDKAQKELPAVAARMAIALALLDAAVDGGPSIEAVRNCDAKKVAVSAMNEFLQWLLTAGINRQQYDAAASRAVERMMHTVQVLEDAEM